MKSLPRILIIDDVYGRAMESENRDRQLFCARLGVRDVTGRGPSASVENPVAEAVLHSGQVRTDQGVANDLEGVVECVRAGWRRWPRWALVLIDMHFQTGPLDPATGEPQGDSRDRDPARYFGLEIIDRLLQEEELTGIPMVILSSMDRKQIEQRFARRGVFAFVEKDQLNREGLDLLLWEHGFLEDDRIVGHSLPVLAALREARRVSRIGNTNVLLLGETGTGKELVGDYIHRTSRREGPLRKVFVRANDDMFAADLFGYMKGAFTGAMRDRAGEAELAHQGTLFFDEFGNIPVGVQDKLMRLLDTAIRETQRIGDSRTRKLDLQVVLATNRFEILRDGFRRDLLQRANASNPILLPPLRKRREDIPLLVEFFVRRHEQRLGAEHREISPGAMELLQASSWPGNVRELENEILKAVSDYRDIRYLSPEHVDAVREREAVPAAPAPPPVAPDLFPEPAAVQRSSLQVVMEGMAGVEFDIESRELWSGQLVEFQGAYARLMARYLQAALAASAIASGEPRPTTAIRMLLGRKTLRTSDAAGTIKRLLSISREAIADLLADESLYLGGTLRWAENLRGGAGRKVTTRRPGKTKG
ncbi:MAG: sigma 54-interacting transcriptional regulator [Acidobacteria bacterium]|nr:sigma 54-interacting transcriptional regulator [Acidobacteriota bacterium]